LAVGLRWLSVVLACSISIALASCDLNPQPEVPGADETAAGGSDGVGGEGGQSGAWNGTPSPGGGTRYDEDTNAADPNDYGGKNNGNLGEVPDDPARPPPPSDQRPSADAGADAHQPPVVAM